jgi:hypothetical protein
LEVALVGGSAAVGVVQVVPAQRKAFPTSSVAAQKEAEGHEIEVRYDWESIKTPVVQVVPRRVTRSPPPTASQKVEDAQEIELNPPPTFRGADHVAPSKVTTLPESSTAAQNAEDAHETEVGAPRVSILTGVVHVVPLNVMA